VDPRLIELWDEIEQHLRAALDEVGSSQRRPVEEFLDHNELGLAWELLVEALAADDVRVSPTARADLERAAELMQFDPSSHAAWSRLR
jgi:hypothetical protein